MGPLLRLPSPPRPVSEVERLKALRDLRILDSGPDPAFDRITQLAARIFQAPVALVTFIDKERQWCKSCVGLKFEQTLRDQAICSYTILQNSVMVVPDTTQDERFAANPVVVENDIRFYAGASLTSANGHNLGTLCILDVQPRTSFSETDAEILKSLADMVSEAIEIHSSRRRLLNARKDVQKRHALVAMTTMDGVWEWNLLTEQVYFSARCQKLLGLPETEVIGHPNHWVDRIHPEDVPALREHFLNQLRGKLHKLDAEHRVRHVNGTWRWVKVQGLIVRGAFNRCERVTGSFVDITQLKTTDVLTGIPNRLPLIDALEDIIRERSSPESQGVAVFMVDVDRFTRINERFGHAAGDHALIVIAHRLRDGVQSLKLGPRSMAARFEGNKFLILLEGVQELELARYIAGRLQDAVSTRVHCKEGDFKPHISVGVALASDIDRANDLVQHAQIALTRSKAEGRALCTAFVPKMLLENVARSRLETELREAIEKHQLRVMYQPQIDLLTGRLTGCEALVRWQHPQLGLLAPASFLSIAEENGFISEIDLWVIETACEQVSRWRSFSRETAELRISVNLSSHKFSELQLNHTIANILEEAALPASALCLEITETVLMRNIEEALPILNKLRQMGVSLHIDDFGAGYSSFAQLYDLPFDTLKIDRSFLKNILTDGRAKAIVEVVLELGKRLDMHVIAEGVEEAAHCSLLRRMGCNTAQGYFYSKPIDPVLFEEKFINPLMHSKSWHPDINQMKPVVLAIGA